MLQLTWFKENNKWEQSNAYWGKNWTCALLSTVVPVFNHYSYISATKYGSPWGNVSRCDDPGQLDAELAAHAQTDDGGTIDAAVEWHTKTSGQDEALVHEDKGPGGVEVKTIGQELRDLWIEN